MEEFYAFRTILTAQTQRQVEKHEERDETAASEAESTLFFSPVNVASSLSTAFSSSRVLLLFLRA